MDKKFEVNQTKIKGSCQLYTKAAPQQSWSDLTLDANTHALDSNMYVDIRPYVVQKVKITRAIRTSFPVLS